MSQLALFSALIGSTRKRYAGQQYSYIIYIFILKDVAIFLFKLIWILVILFYIINLKI